MAERDAPKTDKVKNAEDMKHSTLVTQEQEHDKKHRVPTESKLLGQKKDPARDYHHITVLPKEFEIWANSDFDLPIIDDTPLNDIYPILSEILECPDYIVNPSTFWYLDILAEALDKAQRETPMDLKDQKLVLAWFGHIMSILCEKDWSREEILSNIKSDILAAGYHLSNFSWVVPTPQQEKNYLMTATTSKSFTELNTPKAYSTMAHIVYLISEVFANPFQYRLIQNAFFKHPFIVDVKMPHTLRYPRTYKKEIAEKPIKQRRGSDRKSITKLMKEKQLSDAAKIEESETKETDKDRCILPLREAVTPDFFLNFFPKTRSNFESTSVETKYE